jgi:hypothetical protein
MRIQSRFVIPFAFLIAGCATDQTDSTTVLVTYTEEREICADRSATRNAYFGDLHIHTGFSYDALPLGTKITPADAYNFAKGEPLAVPPYDENGNETGVLTIREPLDFAAVTDHSEFFGELKLCTDPDSEVYFTNTCKLLRTGGGEGMFPFIRMILDEQPERLTEICGENRDQCRNAAISLWQITQDMAEAAYDRTSACEFTALIGYEYTGTTAANNIHRNVIFRNDKVPEAAISYIETPTDKELWIQLTEQCLEGTPGCDVVSIPHNANLGAGAMFPSFIARFESVAEDREMAELRNIVEPLIEIFQHKGNSECFNGFPDILGAADELCQVEQVRRVGDFTDANGEPYSLDFCEDGEVGTRGFTTRACVSKNDFFRTVLLTGLQDEAVIGVNSYKLGVIASTDTHIGVSGHVHEAGWIGHLVEETDFETRLSTIGTSPRDITANPGGLAGVWAVENSRDALFEGMERREVFGTTGTRIEPRFFAGWNIAANACASANVAAAGYDGGVPMGADLVTQPGGGSPAFLVHATRDPNAAPLQKIQIIKGWIDDDGRSNYEVIDVAGAENETGEFLEDTGAWTGSGSDSLCAVYRDPAFDAAKPAYYYMRAVEVPTPRWNWAQCLALPEADRPTGCTNDAPKSIQEMAWTSPIWVMPAK